MPSPNAIPLPLNGAAVQPVDRAFNVAVLQMASRIFPTGFDIGPDAPSTLEALKDHVSKTGRMLVYNWASDQTIFADPEVNWAFRAWHDWTHIQVDGAFNVEGEVKVAKRQIEDLTKVYGPGKATDRFAQLIWAEVMGQVLYADNHGGDFPVDQRAFYAAYAAQPDLAVSHSTRF
jgi:hypothetical protein